MSVSSSYSSLLARSLSSLPEVTLQSQTIRDSFYSSVSSFGDLESKFGQIGPGLAQIQEKTGNNLRNLGENTGKDMNNKLEHKNERTSVGNFHWKKHEENEGESKREMVFDERNKLGRVEEEMLPLASSSGDGLLRSVISYLRVKVATGDSERYQNHLVNFETMLEKLMSENLNLKNQLTNLTQHMSFSSIRDDQLPELRGKALETIQDLRTSQALLATTQKTVLSLSTKLEMSSQCQNFANTSLVQECDRLRSEIEQMQVLVNNKTRACKEVEESWAVAHGKFTSEINDLKSLLNETRMKLEESSKKLEESDLASSERLKDLNILRNKYERLQVTNKSLQEDLESTRTQLNSVNDVCDELHRDNDNLRSAYTNSSISHHHRAEVAKVQDIHASQLREMREALVNSQAEVFKLKESLQSMSISGVKSVEDPKPDSKYVMTNAEWCDAWANITKVLQQTTVEKQSALEKIKDLEFNLQKSCATLNASVVTSNGVFESPKSGGKFLSMQDLVTPMPPTVNVASTPCKSMDSKHDSTFMSPLPVSNSGFDPLSISLLQTPNLRHEKSNDVTVNLFVPNVNTVIKEEQTHELMESMHRLHSQIDVANNELFQCKQEKRNLEKIISELEEKNSKSISSDLVENKLMSNSKPKAVDASIQVSQFTTPAPTVVAAVLEAAKMECRELHTINSRLLDENRVLTTQFVEAKNSNISKSIAMSCKNLDSTQSISNSSTLSRQLSKLRTDAADLVRSSNDSFLSSISQDKITFDSQHSRKYIISNVSTPRIKSENPVEFYSSHNDSLVTVDDNEFLSRVSSLRKRESHIALKKPVYPFSNRYPAK